MRIFTIALALSLACLATAQTPETNPKATKLEALLDEWQTESQFNGAVLVVDRGKVIFARYAGVADFRNPSATPIKENSLFHLGQASEQFTAAAIMKLKEAGKLNYDDELARFIPELNYPGVTLRHLLTHTSGLPDYAALFAIHWTDKVRMASNRDLVQLMKTVKPAAYFASGQRYDYSATNYALLATVIERVSGQSLDFYLRENVFNPLGMKSTLVYTRLRSPNVPGRVYGFRQYVIKSATLDDQVLYTEDIVGSKNVYATLDDLRRWDEAQYSETFLKASTWAEAYAPAKLTGGLPGQVGFSWRAVPTTTFGRMIEQTANLGGFRLVMDRYVEPRNTIIILNNTGNPELEVLRNAITAILHDEEPVRHRPSIAKVVAQAMTQSGIKSAVAKYEDLRRNRADQYNFRESELNQLAYELMELKKLNEAIEIFKLNVSAFPDSWNVYDSLGEAYVAAGNRNDAIENYKRSLELYPDNDNAKQQLKKLGVN